MRQVVRLGANRAGSRNSAASFAISSRYGLGRGQLRNAVGWRSRRACQPLKKFLPKLAKLQRRMARRKKFSKNWRQAKACISKLHTRVANIRKHFLHQVANDISKNHGVVCIEDLAVKNLSKRAAKKVAQKSGLNRSILDASPFELLQYKTQWQGGLLVPVPAQNTSRKCPACGLRSGRESQVASQVRLRRV